MDALTDIQSWHDSRGVPIEEFGISGLRYPVTFDDGTINQVTTADIEMTVGLPAHQRGTHMIRLVQFVTPTSVHCNRYRDGRALTLCAAAGPGCLDLFSIPR